MVQLTNKFVFLVYIFIFRCISNINCQRLPNPKHLPVISANLERDVYPSGYNKSVEFVGEYSILFPQFTEINLTCRANYLIRWDSTMEVKAYALPKKFVLNHEKWNGGLPNIFQYESTITLWVSVNTAGSVACMKLGDRSHSSEILIHGERTGSASTPSPGLPITSLRRAVSIQPLWYYDMCPYDMHINKIKVPNGWIQISESPYYVWSLGVVIWSGSSPLNGFTFCSRGYMLTFEYKDISVPPDAHMTSAHIYSIANFLNQRVPECFQQSCFHWHCSNPFHCSIAEKAIIQQRELYPYCNKHLELGMRKCLINPNLSPTIYMYAGISDSTPRLSYNHKNIMRISTPNEDAVIAKQPSKFTCTGVSFLLSQQIVFGIKFQNESVKYMSDFLKEEKTNVSEGSGLLFKKTMDLTLEPETKTVFCMAPRFDSEEWYNVSMEIRFKPPEETTTLRATDTAGKNAEVANSLPPGVVWPEATIKTKRVVTQQPWTAPTTDNEVPTTRRESDTRGTSTKPTNSWKPRKMNEPELTKKTEVTVTRPPLTTPMDDGSETVIDGAPNTMLTSTPFIYMNNDNL